MGGDKKEITGLAFQYGSESTRLEKRDGDFTHEWTAVVRAAGKENRKLWWVEQVVFKAHPTVEDHTCVCKKEPYEMTRRGWGEFAMDFEVVYKYNLGSWEGQKLIELSQEPNKKRKKVALAVVKPKLKMDSVMSSNESMAARICRDWVAANVNRKDIAAGLTIKMVRNRFTEEVGCKPPKDIFNQALKEFVDRESDDDPADKEEKEAPAPKKRKRNTSENESESETEHKANKRKKGSDGKSKGEKKDKKKGKEKKKDKEKDKESKEKERKKEHDREKETEKDKKSAMVNGSAKSKSKGKKSGSRAGSPEIEKSPKIESKSKTGDKKPKTEEGEHGAVSVTDAEMETLRQRLSELTKPEKVAQVLQVVKERNAKHSFEDGRDYELDLLDVPQAELKRLMVVVGMA
eukprot:comp31970_c0_seq1/m.47262 comp31970_c0_seq1/g.47262  ORF comp31970_c0_seq1/g.47262 comp31970_c0_seq1/m.47262 type:complete len:404 (-) comp31970_c0_seq1:68-1279(-)